MIRSNLIRRTGIAKFKRALDAYALRQRVTAENVANVQTPDYKSRKVIFEENLQKARAGSVTMTPVPNPPRAIPIVPPQQRFVQLRNDDSGYFNGTNDVNLETEMTDLTRTAMAYNLVAKMTRGTFDLLRSAIAGRIK
ncbi:MAG: flagellar basal body rod protein FlgB [Candidatus Krumholzibacteriota bacterium]|nr:flagellar basal body rod protein FlgB [Candidatus Krumholzibacteriota bacterium]